MFSALRPSQPLFGGLLWKIPWRMSAPQKYRQRKRLQRVDRLVETLSNALEKQGGSTIAAIERWKAEMPTEAEMEAKDKYTLFDRKARGYRKGVHKVPKWTRVSQRVNPPGY
ncbi:mitochondrial ribosomal protein L31-domain-containing protein [Trichophaea hybrida]|nr:mitochondrial ribosomal protein L31-domain-containing protein [Trichophaea hybrida]